MCVGEVQTHNCAKYEGSKLYHKQAEEVHEENNRNSCHLNNTGQSDLIVGKLILMTWMYMRVKNSMISVCLGKLFTHDANTDNADTET